MYSASSARSMWVQVIANTCDRCRDRSGESATEAWRGTSVAPLWHWAATFGAAGAHVCDIAAPWWNGASPPRVPRRADLKTVKEIHWRVVVMSCKHDAPCEVVI